MKRNCPNFLTCTLVNDKEFEISQQKKKQYLEDYCTKENDHWIECKRYQASMIFNFCPDFVMPDIDLSLEDILEKIQENKQNGTCCH